MYLSSHINDVFNLFIQQTLRAHVLGSVYIAVNKTKSLLWRSLCCSGGRWQSNAISGNDRHY